jgi:hypothetical protein
VDGDPDNPGDYGKKTYTTELTDDFIFLRNERLGEGDYSIYSIYMSYTEYDYEVNAAGTAYGDQASTSYGKYSDVDLFYKTGVSSDWMLGGAIRRTGPSAYT